MLHVLHLALWVLVGMVAEFCAAWALGSWLAERSALDDEDSQAWDLAGDNRGD